MNQQAHPVVARRQGNWDEEPGYVLHSYAFKETSLIVEVFTRNFGRIGMVAKGARRAKSSLRGMLMQFQPLGISWGGKSELRTLHRAEPVAGHLQLTGRSLMCGFYLNELLLKMLPREDPHDGLFVAYELALANLRSDMPPSWALRRFEKSLLRELGYGLALERDVHGEPVRAESRYGYVVERGPVPFDDLVSDVAPEVFGKTLLDLASDDYCDPTTQQQALTLMRHVLSYHLGGQTLNTRQLLREMLQL